MDLMRVRFVPHPWLALAALVSPGAAPERAALTEPRETRLAEVRQLTFGGENAEAYWSPDGGELIFQSTRPPFACDQIFRRALAPDAEPKLVSSGEGRTTCAFFTGAGILYASTHLAGPECPPPPDRSQGYVWAVHPEYEIFAAERDGAGRRRLTDNQSYDAEATVCARDGAIVFTSARDGDLELYRMDADGGNVRRLTEAPGYDGGAFFSPDCKRIVWRASRPSSADELADYRALLARGLVRPTRLELWIANADGGEPRQITYLGGASFAPSFFPDGERLIFSSNHADPKGREFDLWAIDLDGTGLERVTHTPGFDGFPMFSPDGSRLAFASNRNQSRPGETNVFVARWSGAADAGAAAAAPGPPDRFLADVRWLADDRREGRGIGTEGLDQSASWLEGRFRELGLAPAGENGFRQRMDVPVAVRVDEKGTALAVNGRPIPADQFRPAPFSASAAVEGDVVAAGYGIVGLGRDDYAGIEVRGKIALVRRFVPAGAPFDDPDAERRWGDVRGKAWAARERGALALLVADLPEPAPGDADPREEAPLPELRVDARGDAGLPVVFVRRGVARDLLARGGRVAGRVRLETDTHPAWNIVGRIAAAPADRLPGAVVAGAHYDHLGYGGRASLAPDERAAHNGADDNASGVAALLEAARLAGERRGELRRDLFFVAFSGEEAGILGSTAFTRRPPGGLAIGDVAAMINMDMVGRLRRNRVAVLGSDSAAEWQEMVPPACARLGLGCDLGGDGYGPSDQTPFYAAGVPVLHLFTGTHEDYHKPSDDPEKINAAGGARVGALAAELAIAAAGRAERLTYVTAAAPPPSGDARSYGASLGTVPDYAGPADGRPGVLLAGVRPGGPAEQAGMRRGDLLVELAGRAVRDIHDLMFALRAAKPGESAVAVVERDGQRVELAVVFGRSTR